MKIAWISRKGSVGKTTTAVNLAASLAARKLRVLLVDLDDQASASLSLGVHRRHLAPSMADVLSGQLSMKQALRETSTENLHLVTGSVDLCDVADELRSARRPDQCLRAPLASVEKDFDAVILDCPAGLGAFPIAALVAADGYAVGLTPQFLVLDGLGNFLERLERQRYRLGSQAKLLGILLTQVDYRTRTTRPYVDGIREQFGSSVFETEIRINVKLAEAPSFGKTIFQYAPESSGAAGYWTLADEVLRRWKIAREDLPRSAPQPELPIPQKPRTLASPRSMAVDPAPFASVEQTSEV